MVEKLSKKCKSFVFCMIFVASAAFSQQISLKESTSKPFAHPSRFFYSTIRGPQYTIRPVSGDFYVKNLGFFCKQELKLEAITRIPFRFRLGSLNYCDRMEGKKNAGILPAY